MTRVGQNKKGMVLSQIGAGHSVEDVLVDYPYLEREDIMQAIRYAAWRAEEREVMLMRRVCIAHTARRLRDFPKR